MLVENISLHTKENVLASLLIFFYYWLLFSSSESK
ncbi:hypothetical protein [Peribacillus muralis]|nr:hypothetical protein [Peribacillus muralis]